MATTVVMIPKVSFEDVGWTVTGPVFDSGDIRELLDELGDAWRANEAAGRGGVRNLLRTHGTVRRLATSGPMRAAAEEVVGANTGAVRALLFDKTAGANWKVVWHQDLTIAVRKQLPTSDYGPWSMKEGVVHVQPPQAVLEQMVAVRLHLDPCARANGPVRVISGSHRHGRLSPNSIEELRRTSEESICEVEMGGLLLFRPLLLHASSPAELPQHRRVLHIEYGPPTLPGGVEWDLWLASSMSNNDCP